MADEFRGLNLCTSYKASGSINMVHNEAPCFAAMFNRLFAEGENVAKENFTVNYEIYLSKGIEDTVIHHRNNACFLTKEQLEAWVEYLHNYFPFEFSVKETIEDFTVMATLSGVPQLGHKLFMTWVRYTYEFPKNVAILDTLKLRKLPEFKNETLLNLAHLTISHFASARSDQQIIESSNFAIITPEAIMNSLREKVYLKQIPLKNVMRAHYFDRDNTNTYQFNWWKDAKVFETIRKPRYINTYKECEKLKSS